MNDVHNIFAPDGFFWWFGVVESRDDPLKLGRVQVRILGYHTDSKALLPTEDLPWAMPLQPITSAAISGVGSAPLGPVPGTWCMGFFMDGKNCQQPMVMGTIAGKPGENIQEGVGGGGGENTRCNPPGVEGNVVTDGSGNVVRDGSGNPVRTETTPVPPPKDQNVNKNLLLVVEKCIQVGITDPLALAAIVGNVQKECGGKAQAERAYNTTKAPRLRELFSGRVKQFSDSELEALAKDPVAFGDVIYGYKSGKTGKQFNNDQPGDGWAYRGRGFIQHTGKSQYGNISKYLYGDNRLLTNPDLLNQPEGAASGTAWFMKYSSAPGSASRNTGLAPPFRTQYDADVWATSTVAGGRDIRKITSKDGPIGEKILAKVNGYSANWTPGTPGGDKIAELLKKAGKSAPPPQAKPGPDLGKTNKDPAGPLNPPGAGNPPPFSDPNGRYPDCGYSGSPDTNKLAQGDVGKS